ncbi:uncharacterized protein LOC129909921 [Episyrphus balteatus]|uniref:uncharacterized protein LOC129909921 n=1 Tax=Episyrphus balteatus TaxID=286459 RepID=UPI0024856E8C|nr:uncharacterized protein LOC129909921 [Episyrphus balteatus]
MIIKELSKFIIIDEIRENASDSELYFLSCLLGYETLAIPEDWKGRIYTSQFIYDVLIRKKPKVHPKCLRVLKSDVALKFKSKGKVIWVTMFEAEEIKNNVMFYFDDGVQTYLYTGAFNEISSCLKNEHFMLCVQKGIDYAYIDSTLCKCNPYISTEDTIDEIKAIALKHHYSRLAVVLPSFGYEHLLQELVKAFPENVYPTKGQRYILDKLGYSNLLSRNPQTCRIVICNSVLTEHLETDIITIYITVGDAPTKTNEYGVYVRQWSPLPSLMDHLVLMEKIRPNYIIPIEQNPFLENVDLPFNLMWFAKKKSNEEFKATNSITGDSIGCVSDNDSNESMEASCSEANKTTKYSQVVSLPSTKTFDAQTSGTKTEITVKPKELVKNEKVSSPDKVATQLPVTQTSINLVKQRTRFRPRRESLVFTDSDEGFP